MKYIDAEKLKKEIENLKIDFIKFHTGIDLELVKSYLGYRSYENVLSIIDSLQQEQPEVDLVANLKHHLATTPKEQLEKEWKDLEPWGNIGPTVQEFLYGKQSEVDLEKEIGISFLYRMDMEDFARHFYELGLNAKKIE